MRVVREHPVLLHPDAGGCALVVAELDPKEVRAILGRAARLGADPQQFVATRLQAYLDRQTTKGQN